MTFSDQSLTIPVLEFKLNKDLTFFSVTFAFRKGKEMVGGQAFAFGVVFGGRGRRWMNTVH